MINTVKRVAYAMLLNGKPQSTFLLIMLLGILLLIFYIAYISAFHIRSAQREYAVLKRRDLAFKSGEFIEESAAKKVERPMPSFPKAKIDEGMPLKLDIKDYETTLLVESALDIEEGYETTLL